MKTAPASPDTRIIAELTGQPAEQVAASSSDQAAGRLLIEDGLTGLYNRRYLQHRLAMELAAAKQAGETLALLVMDLNGFKQINDQYGHAAGDHLLRAVARLVAARLPATGIAARYGGDEFVVVLPRWGAEDALGWAELAMKDLAGIGPADGQYWAVQVSASAGLAMWPDDGPDGDTLFAAADRSMYHAKHRLGGGVYRSGHPQALGRAMPVLDGRGEAPVVGRDRELARLQAAVTAGGQVIGITGGSGCGKTRLLQEAARAAGQASWCTVTGGDSHPGELGGLRHLIQQLLASPRAGTAVREALADLPAGQRTLLAAMLPDAAPEPPSGTVEQVLAAAGAWLWAAAERQRLWISVDDFHQWDEAGQDLARLLAAQPHPRLVFIFACDQGADTAVPVLEVLRTMAQEGFPAAVLELAPLDAAATSELVRAMLLGHVAQDLIQSVVQRTGGNPLALHSLLQGWADRGRLVHGGDGWRLVPDHREDAGDASLAGALAARLDVADRDVWHLLQALAVSERPWREGTICRMVGLRPAEVQPLLAAAAELRILVCRDGEWRFAHGVLRGLVVARTGRLPLRSWHRLAAEVRAEMQEAGPAELAAHWERAGDATQAIACYRQAAAAAGAVAAHQSAGKMLRKAAELAASQESTATAAPELWEQAGNAFFRGGNWIEAYRCLGNAQPDPAHPVRAAGIWLVMAHAIQADDQYYQALAFAEQALAVLADHPPSELKLRLAAMHAHLLSGLEGEHQAALRIAMASARTARQQGWADLEAGALLGAARTRLWSGRRRSATTYFRRAAAVPGVSGEMAGGIALQRCYFCREPGQALHAIRLGLDMAVQYGNNSRIIYASTLLLYTLGAVGQWDEATSLYETTLALAWRTTPLRQVAQIAAGWGSLFARRGRLQAASAIYDRLCSWPELTDWFPVTYLGATLALERGQPEQAIALIQRCFGGKWPTRADHANLYLVGAEAWLERGNPDEAEAWLRRAWQRSSPDFYPLSLRGWNLLLEGWIAEARGQFDQALQAFARARRGPWQVRHRVTGCLAEARLMHKLGRDPALALRLARQAERDGRRWDFLPVTVAAAGLLTAMGGRTARPVRREPELSEATARRVLLHPLAAGITPPARVIGQR